MHHVLCWVTEHGHWKGARYATRRLPKHVAPGDTTGDWCDDSAAIHEHWAAETPLGHVCVTERLRAV